MVRLKENDFMQLDDNVMHKIKVKKLNAVALKKSIMDNN